MKADKNDNGKIEIGELKNFLTEYRSIRSKIQGQTQVKAGVVELSRPVRKLVIMNDRS